MTTAELLASFPTDEWIYGVCRECGGCTVMRKERGRARLSGTCLECLLGFISYPEIELARTQGDNRFPWIAVFDGGYRPASWVQEGRVDSGLT